MPAYRRILLKLSGEALAGEAGFGLDRVRCSEIAAEIAAVVQQGAQVALVVGGGNFFRGIKADKTGLQRVTVDRMGMLATTINALAMTDLLIAGGVGAETMSAVAMGPLAPPVDRGRALELLNAGKVVVFAAGTGNPYFSTDSAAALRAIEIEADVLAKATKVDGVYDKDPVLHPDARRYEKISYAEVLEKDLAVMDAAAIALCRDARMPVLVFNLNEDGSIGRASRGEQSGTLMT